MQQEDCIPGMPIWWQDSPSKGYGVFSPVIAVFVKHGKVRAGIAVLRRDGSWVPKWVKYTKITERRG